MKPHSPRTSTVATAVASVIWGGIATPAAAAESTPAGTAPPDELDPVLVEGDWLNRPASSKYTAPPTDTPQTITIVTQETIAQQNLLSLRDILSTVPGITFGAGEGGGGYGDSINLRGFAGSNDVTVDGFRDSAQYTRSDPFNLEQVEVVNGANSVYAGSGSVGGTINLVSKTARPDDSHRITLGGGFSSYGRFTSDINRRLGDTTAVRLNVMGHGNEVPEREVERSRRWGVAPSIAYGIGTSSALAVSYLHQHDNNIPQYGVPTWDGRILPGARRESYFGYAGIDRQVNDTDAVTVGFTHRFNDRVSLRSLTRWQQTDQFSRVDPPQGTYCLANGLSPSNPSGTNPTGGLGPCPEGFQPDEYQPSGPRGTTRDTRNQLLTTQADLNLRFMTGPIEHTLVAGLAMTSESYSLKNGNSLRNPDGATPNPALPRTSISNPDYDAYTGPVNFILSSTSDARLDNKALYVFDNIRLSQRWSINGGLRIEDNDAGFATVSHATPAAGGTPTPGLPGASRESLLSYRAGLVFKPAATGSIYLAFGNSQTPSIASVNGTCAVSGTNNNCNLDPEEAVNIELGTKWELPGSRLSINAAVARNERTNYRVNDPDPLNASGVQVLDGSARVDSILLGAAGRITDRWHVYANYTYLHSEVLQGVSDYVAGLGQDYTRGDHLTNVPAHAASLWTTWDVRRGLQLGYGITWQDSVYISQHTAPTGPFPEGSALPRVGGYVVHRLMASYSVRRDLQVQLNVNNLFDAEYLTRLRTQRLAWATPGEARSIVLSANLSF